MPLFGVPFRGQGQHRRPRAGRPPPRVRPSARGVGHATAVARSDRSRCVCLGKTNSISSHGRLVGARSPYGRRAAPSRPSASAAGRAPLGRRRVAPRRAVALAPTRPAPAACRRAQQHRRAQPTPGPRELCRVLPACRSIDCVSVLALNVADARRCWPSSKGPTQPMRPAHSPPDRRSSVRPCASAFHTHRSSRATSATPPRSTSRDAARSARPPRPCRRFRTLHAVAELLYGGPWVAERHAVVQAFDGTRPGPARRHRRQVIARANDSTRPTPSAPSMRCAKPSATTPRCAAGRRADGADRADTPDARRQSTSTRWAPNALLGTYTTSSTCSAGARSRCRRLLQTTGCRLA